MPCGTSATCDCLCTKVDISGLSYNSISYDTTTAHLPPGTSPDPFCSCTISAVVPMHRTGSGTPGTFDDLTIRVELHDGCILYSEATLAVSGSPVWSGKCTSTVYCTSSRFSCGTVGASGGISLASWSVYGNSFTLTIDGDDCISYLYDRCDRPGASGAWVRIGSDGGDCIIAGGVAYGKVTSPVQPTSGAITAIPTTINIVGMTFTYDDDNVNGGSNHRTWTACEMGISNNLAVNKGSASGGWVDIYTAPSAGVCRVWAQPYQNSALDIKKNGTVILTNWPDLIGRAAAIQVVLGDVIAVYCRHRDYGWGTPAYSFFLPNTYP